MNRRLGKRKRMSSQQPNARDHARDPADQEQRSPGKPNTDAAAARGKVHTPETDSERTEANQKDKHWLDYAIGIFAFIAAIGGVFAAVFSGWQAWVTGDAEVRQLRAYVHMVNGDMVVNGDAKGPINFSIRPHVKVYGQTPAGALTLEWESSIGPWPMTDSFPFVNYFQQKMDTTTSMAPGEERPAAEVMSKTVTPENIALINAGAHRLYIYGTIFYVDVFRKARYTNFCWWWDVPSLLQKIAHDCPIHNGADWHNSSEGGASTMTVPMK